MLLLIIGNLAIQLVAGAKILETLEVAPYNTALLITAVVITFYLFTSGFRAVIWTDFVLAVLIIILISFLSVQAGQNITAEAFEFEKMPIGNIVGFFLYGILGPFAQTIYFQRIFAADSPKTAQRGTWISGAVVALLLCLMIAIGFAAKILAPGSDPDLAFIAFLEVRGGTILTAGALLLWAALMSSADTLTFAGSQVFSRDILRKGSSVAATRWSIFGIIGLALLFSYTMPSIATIGIIFIGGGMIIAPITFGSWFCRFSELTILCALSIGTLSLILSVWFQGVSPTLVVVVLLASTLTLAGVEEGLRIRRKTG